jgi:beta-phosphoglucomutase-like phosphatase (HAD superfamily)
MIKAILFNLNGTLIDTLKADQIAKKSIVEKYGQQFDQ